MAFKHFIVAAITASAAGPVAAQMVTAADPASIAAALQAEGYAAKVEKGSDGDPVIRSQSSGSNFSVLFYNCNNGKNCATVQFYAGYKVEAGKAPSFEQINEWNKTNRFGRAYLDNSNDPVIEMDVDLDDGGMSRALFIDNLQFWTAVMARFEKHIGW
jgi:putative sensory transduction regulator